MSRSGRGSSSESAARDVPSHATGHYRIKYRQAAFSDGERAHRNQEKNARIRSALSLSLSFSLCVGFVSRLGCSVDSSALQSVCPPTPAALIIGSAKLSPSNSSPASPLAALAALAALAGRFGRLSFSIRFYPRLLLSLLRCERDPLPPPPPGTLLNGVPIGYY